MTRKIRAYFLVLTIISCAVFMVLTVEMNFIPRLYLKLPNNCTFESKISSIIKEETTRISDTYSAALSIISGAGSETLGLANFILAQNGKIPLSTAIKQASAFIRYSGIYDIPLKVAVAVANTESHFKPEAKSSYGSAGVMQVTWRVHKKALIAQGFKNGEELHDPILGIKAGCFVLSRYISSTKNLKTALSRYYGGSAEVYWGRISRNIKKYDKYEQKRKGKK